MDETYSAPQSERRSAFESLSKEAAARPRSIGAILGGVVRGAVPTTAPPTPTGLTIADAIKVAEDQQQVLLSDLQELLQAYSMLEQRLTPILTEPTAPAPDVSQDPVPSGSTPVGQRILALASTTASHVQAVRTVRLLLQRLAQRIDF